MMDDYLPAVLRLTHLQRYRFFCIYRDEDMEQPEKTECRRAVVTIASTCHRVQIIYTPNQKKESLCGIYESFWCL